MKQNLLTKVLLLFALIVGSSSAWADDVLVYTLDGTITTEGNSNYAEDGGGLTQNGMSWSVTGNTTINPWRIGGKSLTEVDRDIKGYNSFSEALSKITVNHTGTTSNSVIVNSVKLTVASDNEFSTVIDEVTLTPTFSKDVSGSFSFTPTSPLTVWTANCFYKLTFNLTITTTSNNALRISSIQFYKEVSVNPTTTTISDSDITNTNLANGTAAGSFSATVTSGDNTVSGATVSWTSSDEDVALINASTGVVTLVSSGTTTITASYAGDGNTYGASSDTYELTVTDSRAEAGLAYDVEDQTINVGDILTAPTLTNPNGLTITYESGNENIATVDADGNVTGVAFGTTTITAKFAGNSTFMPGSASYTIIVMNAGDLFYEGMSGYTGTSDVSSELSTTYNNLDSDQWESFSKVYAGKVLKGDSNGHLKFGSGSYVGKAVTKSIPLIGNGKLTYKVQRYDSNNEGNLKITVEGANAVGDLDVTGTGSWVEKTVKLTGAEGNVVITFETTSNNKRIRVDDILLVEVTTESATIAESGYTTFCSPFDLSFENVGGLNAAYVVSQSTDAVATLKKVTAVPAGTGVVLKGTKGSVKIPVVEYTGDDISNLLEGTLEETPVEAETVYVVSGGKFMLFAGTSIPAGKAYLPVSAVIGEGAPSLSFEFDDETTSIQNIERTIKDNQYYSLDGRRVAQPTKGLYILNGRKVIVK